MILANMSFSAYKNIHVQETGRHCRVHCLLASGHSFQLWNAHEEGEDCQDSKANGSQGHGLCIMVVPC